MRALAYLILLFGVSLPAYGQFLTGRYPAFIYGRPGSPEYFVDPFAIGYQGDRIANGGESAPSYWAPARRRGVRETRRYRYDNRVAPTYLLPRTRTHGRYTQQAPVWNTFIRSFHQCAPGCEPAQYSTWGHRHNRSCHPSGHALDLHGMICGGRFYRAIDSRRDGGRFDSFVRCMRGHMHVLWKNGRHITQGHHDHVHLSIGCVSRGWRTI
ncbi:MAG: hypothetical protein HC902_12630 [Calothrix sp. SM1_5_4]|nr:hypothetical protein [Calothrix sp. SM1_5_4]